jgi:hypothetical protein
MTNDADPNKDAAPASGEPAKPASQESAAREAAGKALRHAQEGVTAGVETFKKLDSWARIYLVGLGIAIVCSLLFDVMSVNVKGSGLPTEFFKTVTANQSITVFDTGAKGMLAVLSAAAGIALWAWNRSAARKDAWVPLALAGCAGFSALMFLVLLARSGKPASGMAGVGIEIDVDMTFLGFWVPFAGALAATCVSVKAIVKSA